MSNRVAISRVRGGDVESAVRDSVDLAGGFAQRVAAGSRVLIKPNLCKAARRGSGFVTDAGVVEAVAKLVLEMSPASVVIAEGAMAGYDSEGYPTDDALVVTGVAAVGRRLGVEVRNLNVDTWEEVDIPGALVLDKVKIATTVLESDVIISVPVLKTHLRTNVTLSLKNMNGAMPGAEKRKSHRLGLDQAIADLNSVIGPHYAIIDATVGMEGTWRIPEDSRAMGLIVAGSDPVYVDVVGASLMGIDAALVWHLQLAAKREGKQAALSAIEVVGEDVAGCRQSFKAAFDVFRSRFPQVDIVLGEGACSGCTAELVSALSYMSKAGYDEQMKGLTVVVGKPPVVDISGRAVAVGDCAKGMADGVVHVAGCQPGDRDIIHGLCEACGADEGLVLATMEQTREKLWADSAAVLQR